MKLPVITVKDKRTNRETILSDKMEILRIVQTEDIITLEDMQYFKSDYRLAQDAIKYMGLLEIFEQYVNQEVKSLRSRELENMAGKCRDLLRKFLIMVDNEICATQQQQLDFGYNSIRIPISIDEEEHGAFEVWHEVNVTMQEWEKITKIAYNIARVNDTKENCFKEMADHGYTQRELLDICMIYFDFCHGNISIEEGKNRLEQIKKTVVRNIAPEKIPSPK